MLIGIRFGRGIVNIEVPDQNLVAVLDIQPSAAPIADSEATISQAFTAPCLILSSRVSKRSANRLRDDF